MTRGQRMSSVGPYLPWNGLVDPGDLATVGGRAAAAWGYAGGTSTGVSPVVAIRRIFRRLIRRSVTAGGRRWR